MVSSTERAIFERWKSGKKATISEVIEVTKPIMEDICIKPRYVQGNMNQTLKETFGTTKKTDKIAVIGGTTKQLERAGVPKGFGGWSAEVEDKHKKLRLIYINTDMPPESQVLTLAHETGHHVLKEAANPRTPVYKPHTKSERSAKTVERAFGERWNDKYKTQEFEFAYKKTGAIKKHKGDNTHIRNNLKPQYSKKGCKW